MKLKTYIERLEPTKSLTLEFINDFPKIHKRDKEYFIEVLAGEHHREYLDVWQDNLQLKYLIERLNSLNNVLETLTYKGLVDRSNLTKSGGITLQLYTKKITAEQLEREYIIWKGLLDHVAKQSNTGVVKMTWHIQNYKG